MPKRGAKPKPTALKLVQGTDRPDRVNPNEPEPEAVIPEPPGEWAKSNPVALAEWERLTPHLYTLGLLTAVDRAVIVAYCEAWSRLRQAEAEIAENGLLVETTNGNVIQSPAVGIANTAFKNMLTAATEFGLTPSSRTRVTPVGGKRTENPFKNLKNGG